MAGVVLASFAFCLFESGCAGMSVADGGSGFSIDPNVEMAQGPVDASNSRLAVKLSSAVPRPEAVLLGPGYALASCKDGKIAKVALKGGGVQTVATVPSADLRGMAWDEKQGAAGGLVYACDLANGLLWQVPLSGSGSPTRVAEVQGAHGVALDGKGNAVVVTNDGKLFSVNVETGYPTLIASGMGSDCTVVLDTRQTPVMAYVSDSAGGQLWQVPVNGKPATAKVCVTGMTQATDVTLRQHPAADGVFPLAYVTCADGRMWRVPLDPAATTALAVAVPDNLAVLKLGKASSVRFSEEGTAFVTTAEDTTGVLWQVDTIDLHLLGNAEPTDGYAVCRHYTYTGKEDTFTVPENATTLNIRMWGAGGGGGGGFTRGSVDVAPGETIGLSVAGSRGNGGGGMSIMWRSTEPDKATLIAGGGGGGGTGAGGGGGGTSGGAGGSSVGAVGGGGGHEGMGGAGGNNGPAQPWSGPGANGQGTGYHGGGHGGAPSGSMGGGGDGWGGGGSGSWYHLNGGTLAAGGGGGGGYPAGLGVTDGVTTAGLAGSEQGNKAAGQDDSQYMADTGDAGKNGQIVIQWGDKALTAPVVKDPAEGASTGSQPQFTGTAEGAATVSAIEGTVPIATKVPVTEGLWSFYRTDGQPFSNGPHTVNVYASNTAGASSEFTPVNFTVGGTGPGTGPGTPTITTPRESQTTGPSPDFTGTLPKPVPEGTTIHAVDENNTVIADGIKVTADGTWIFDRRSTAGLWTTGAHTVTVTAVNGQTTSAPATVHFTVQASGGQPGGGGQFSVEPGSAAPVDVTAGGPTGYAGVGIRNTGTTAVPAQNVTVVLPAGAGLRFVPEQGTTFLLTVMDTSYVTRQYPGVLSGDGQSLTIAGAVLPLPAAGAFCAAWVAVAANPNAPAQQNTLTFTVGSQASPSTPVRVNGGVQGRFTMAPGDGTTDLIRGGGNGYASVKLTNTGTGPVPTQEFTVTLPPNRGLRLVPEGNPDYLLTVMSSSGAITSYPGIPESGGQQLTFPDVTLPLPSTGAFCLAWVAVAALPTAPLGSSTLTFFTAEGKTSPTRPVNVADGPATPPAVFAVKPADPNNTPLQPGGGPGYPGIRVTNTGTIPVPPQNITVTLPTTPALAGHLRFAPETGNQYLLSVAPGFGRVNYLTYPGTLSPDQQTLTFNRVPLAIDQTGQTSALWTAVTANPTTPTGDTTLTYTIGTQQTPTNTLHIA